MLKLTSIEAYNFKKHEELNIDFADGLNVIVGPNYKGKSTVLHAILFAFFGSTAVPGGSKVIPRRGTRNATEVSLKADTSDGQLVILRSLTGCRVFLNGELKSEGTSPSNQWIEEYLGADKSTVLSLGYAEQSETAALLTLGVSKTNSLIEEVSRISYVDVLIKKASAKCDALSTSAENYEDARQVIENLEASIATRELELASCSKEISELNIEKSAKEASKKKASDLTESIRKGLSELKRVNGLRTQITSELSTHVSEYNSYRDSLSELVSSFGEEEAIREEQETCEEAARGAKKAYDFISAQLHELTEFSSKLEVEKENYSKLTEQNSKYEAAPKLTDEPEKLQKANENLRAIEAKISEVNSKVVKLKRELNEGVCTSCNRPFENFDEEAHKKAFEEAKNELSSFKVESSSISQEIEELEKVIREVRKQQKPEDFDKNLEESKKRIDKYESSLKSIGLTKSELRGKLIEEETEHSKASQRIRVLDSALDKIIDCKKRVETKETRIGEIKVKLEEVEEQYESLPKFTESDLNSALAESKEAEAEFLSVLDKLTSVSSKMSSLKAYNDSESKEIAKQAQRKAKAEEDAAKLKKYKAFVNWLRKSKTEFMSNIWNGVMSSTSEFTRLSTDGKVSDVLRNGDGDFFFAESGEQEPLPVGGCASGGQKAIMGTGLKIALSQYLPQGFGFMLLDEPSSELNSEHTAMLSAALKSTGQQIIMVSHREADETVCDNLIEL